MKGKINLTIILFFYSFLNTIAQKSIKNSSNYSLGRFNIGIDGLSLIQSLVFQDTKAIGAIVNWQIVPTVGLQFTTSYYDVENEHFITKSDLVNYLNYKTLNLGSALIVTDKPEVAKKVNLCFFFGLGFNQSQNDIYYEVRIYDNMYEYKDMPVRFKFTQLTIHAILGLAIIKRNKFRINFTTNLGVDQNLADADYYFPTDNFPGNGVSLGKFNFGIGTNMYFKIF